MLMQIRQFMHSHDPKGGWMEADILAMYNALNMASWLYNDDLDTHMVHFYIVQLLNIGFKEEDTSVQMKNALQFMQDNDPNGFWMEWYDQIQRGEKTFDVDYVLETLDEWYVDSGDKKYRRMAANIIVAHKRGEIQ